jgi:hypothetical protein
MIIVDPNILSEPMKADGNPAVLAWLDRQVPETFYLGGGWSDRRNCRCSWFRYCNTRHKPIYGCRRTRHQSVGA